MDDASLFRFPPGYRTIDTQAGVRLVGVERAERPDHRGHQPRPAAAATPPAAWPRRWRCATTTATAASSTPARCARATASRATSSTSRAAAPTRCAWRCRASSAPTRSTGERGARRARPVRRLQGLQARLPDRRRHGAHEARSAGAAPCAVRCHAERPADRPPARLCAVGEPAAVAVQPAQPLARAGATGRARARAVGAAAVARMAQRHVLAPVAGPRAGFARRVARGACRRRQHRGAVGRHLQRLLRARQRGGRRAVLQAAGYTVHAARSAERPHAVLRPHAPGGRAWPSAQAPRRRRVDRRAAAVCRARHRDRRARAVVPADAARRVRW